MSAITWPEDVPADAWGVRHLRCGQTFPTRGEDDLAAVDDGAGKLVCWACEEDERGTGYGFAPVKASPSATDRVGGAGWSPIPFWLARAEAGPDLTSLEFRLIVALWAFQGENGSARPGLERLATIAGRDKRTVGRALDGLVSRGVIRRWRPGARETYRYDLSLLMRGEGPDRGSLTGDADVPSEPLAGDVHVPCEDDATGSQGTSTSALEGMPTSPLQGTPTSPEVEPGEEEPAEVEPADAGPAAAGGEREPIGESSEEPATYDPLADDEAEWGPDQLRMLEAMRRRRGQGRRAA